ncbi:MAG: DHH family phosphoesterase [Pseudomonadota bacterium]
MVAKARLEKFYSVFSGDSRVLVLINADPDAIASAMAVKRLLWRRASEVTISHFNIISRPDNLAMIRLLVPDIRPMKEISGNQYSQVVVVDSQPDHHECFAEFRCDVIIDHHPVSCDSGKYNDIRPEYGSCSSILAEYIKAARIKPSQKLATALVLGIKTDTGGFLRHTALEDVKAFQYLYQYANPYLLKRIEQAELGDEDADHLSQAIRYRILRNNMVFSHAGEVSNPDQCVITADFFMKIVSVHWSIVSGLYQDKLVIILRNDGIRKSAGHLAKKAFGKYGSAGGHKTMARAEISRDDLEPGTNIQQWIIERIEKYA